MKAIGISVATAFVAASAHGSMVSFTSNPGLEGLGSFTGSMEWAYPVEGGDCGELAIRLVNTSPGENGGFLTGFAFNTISGLDIAFITQGDRWTGVAGVAADPFGVFDYGVALDGNFLGGGSPVDGIAVGGERKFLFTVCAEASVLEALQASDFFDESAGFGFVARFKGFNDDGSDKVTASLPSPGALALFACAGIGSRARRRRA
ncbi:MAG: hypothetical protein RL136_2129 [Planctomycetota bacterium]|jgi:hypothetical protein